MLFVWYYNDFYCVVVVSADTIENARQIATKHITDKCTDCYGEFTPVVCNFINTEEPLVPADDCLAFESL